MIIYKWDFSQFIVAKSEDGLTDVVKEIYWIYNAYDDTYFANKYGTLRLGPPNPTNFTPYDQLTEQWAIDAVSAQVDVPAMQVELAAQIEDEKNPPIVPMPPPFPQGGE